MKFVNNILSGAMNVLFILQCCVFFFFFCVCTRERIEIMLQFQTLGMVSDSKMNLVGALGRSSFEFPNSFQKRREKPEKKKLRKNGNFYAKLVFDQIDFFYMVVIQKIIVLNFQKILTFFDVDKKMLDDQKFTILQNLSKTRKFARNSVTITYKSLHRHNFFQLAFELRVENLIKKKY
ncbi:Uncharacterized protein FWK35_00022634, partial [Aphis craccivora]